MINREQREQLVKDTESLKNVLGDLPRIDPGKTVDERIMSVAREELQWNQVRNPWFDWSWNVPMRRAVGACAAAALLLFICVFGGMQNFFQQSSISPSGMEPVEIEQSNTYAHILQELDVVLAKAPLRATQPGKEDSILSSGRRSERSHLERARMRYFGSDVGSQFRGGGSV